MLRKRTILNIKNVYTANAFQTGAGFFVGAGSETEPMVLLYDMDTCQQSKVDGCPGGMMSFVPVPGQPDTFVSVMGLFPPFIGKEAGLFVHQKTDEGWNTKKALNLPFAHRCEFISRSGEVFLVTASVSRHKENPADWSRPGEVHVISLEDMVNVPWDSKIADSGLTRNHGMIKTIMDGKESICVSGVEGIFSIEPARNGHWTTRTLFEKEVSEMTFIDLDGDGTNELVTIEPFHGNTLNIYKRKGSDWELNFNDTLSFGHGLSSGRFNGKPLIVVGNRSGSMSLETFTVNDLSKGVVNREVIEEEAGPTQTQVFSHGPVDFIMSANQRKNEVALYSSGSG